MTPYNLINVERENNNNNNNQTTATTKKTDLIELNHMKCTLLLLLYNNERTKV